MIIFDQAAEDAPVQRFDPRMRVAVATVLAVALCLSQRGLVVGAGLAAAVLLLPAAGLPWRRLRKRFIEVNLLMATIAILLPLSYGGEALAGWGRLTVSREGLAAAGMIALKANATVALMTALVSPMGPTAFGHAVRGLGMPAKLSQILFFLVRYTEVVHEEYHRLRHAMLLRGFRARCNLHSLKALGYLVGMLFVRTLDRSERVAAAMKCRGFNGEFHVLTSWQLRARDWVLAAAGAVGVGVIAWGGAAWPIP